MTSEVQQMPPDATHDTPVQGAQTAPTSPAPPANTTPPETPAAQPAAPVGQPPAAPPAAIGRGWNWFLRMLSIVLAVGAGFAQLAAIATWWGSAESGTPIPDWLFGLEMLGCFVLAALAAALFRSWWAVLIVPIAYFIGAHLVLLVAGGFNVQQWFLQSVVGGLTGGPYMYLWILAPAVVAAVIGVPIGKWVARRMGR